MKQDKSEIQDLFLKEKPAEAIKTIRKTRGDIYHRIVSKKIDCTYAHTVKVISMMEQHGLVNVKKDGRKKMLTLTEEGEKIADCLIDMSDIERNIGHKLESEESIAQEA